MTDIKTDTCRIPVDVIAAASKAFNAGKIQASILDGDENEGIVQVRIEYQSSSPFQQRVIDDVLYMINEYNAYRYDDGNSMNEDSVNDDY